MEERKSKLQEENLNPRFGPLALDALCVVLQGVFIGAEGIRVQIELLHEKSSRDKLGLPRKLGRVSAAW